MDVPSCIVGIDSAVEIISSWLHNGSPDIEVGVIHGMGGVGKTIAKVVDNSKSVTTACLKVVALLQTLEDRHLKKMAHYLHTTTDNIEPVWK